MNTRTSLLASVLVFLPSPIFADTAGRLLQLLAVPGVAGYEDRVREAIEMSLRWQRL